MAKDSGGKANDFLEILMLTGFFCAVFFGCWGGYLQFAKSGERERRDLENQRTSDLVKLLKEPASVQTKHDFMRRQQSQRGGNMRADVTEVLDAMPRNNVPAIERFTERGAGGPTIPGVEKQEYKCEFQTGGTLGSYLSFLGRLKQSKPHIDVTRLEMARKTARGADDSAGADSWDVSVQLLALVAKDPPEAAKAP
ncbi:MAG: hypothetical protein AB7O52_12335 [Planctomycetota bacterium]